MTIFVSVQIERFHLQQLQSKRVDIEFPLLMVFNYG